jgi:hypothetical protein
MRMLGTSLLIAAGLFAATVALFLWFEPTVPAWLVFGPGFIIKSALEGLGLSVTNRAAVLSTFICWWGLSWALLWMLNAKRTA